MAAGTIVSNGGNDIVFLGGKASGTIISSGGIETVSSGGIVSGATVLTGGKETILAGGSAVSTIVSSGGIEQVVTSGATLSNFTLASGGAIDVTNLAFVNGGSGSVNSNGLLTIIEGGVTYTQQLSSHYTGENVVLASDGASGTIAQIYTKYVASSGQTLSGAVLYVGDTLQVLSGGTAVGTVLSGFFSNTGYPNYTYVSSGGTVIVSSGGIASGTIISSGGQQIVLSGGIDSGSLLLDAGIEYVSSGGTVISTTVSAVNQYYEGCQGRPHSLRGRRGQRDHLHGFQRRQRRRQRVHLGHP